MYTQCPECLSFFPLSAAELAAGRGNVRCGHCHIIFDALNSLTEQPPLEWSLTSLSSDEVGTLQTPQPVDVPVLRASAVEGRLLLDHNAPPAVATELQPAPLPFFAQATSARKTNRNRPWIFSSSVLCLTLLAQIAWAERASWIDNEQIRASLNRVCAMLHCQLPFHRNAAKLELLSRDIRPHPSVPGALIISATLRNAADIAQPFPVMNITLSDLDENRIAMRRFQPFEYIGDSHALTTGLVPGAVTALIFEVADPGKNAVAFEFKFE